MNRPIKLNVSCSASACERTVYVYWFRTSDNELHFAFNGCDFMSKCAACDGCSLSTLSLIRSDPDNYLPIAPAFEPMP